MRLPSLLPSGFRAAWLAALLALAPLAASAQPVVLTGAPASAAGRRVLAAANEELAGPLREAQRTLSQTRKRFQKGLATNEQCLVTVRLVVADTVFRRMQARVLGWADGRVQALVPTGAGDERVPLSFPESAVIDWTILRHDGREEGNYIGRYLDLARQLENMPLR